MIPTLPTIHDAALNERVLIEPLGDWQLYGPDHRTSRYRALLRRDECGLQFLKHDSRHGLISILTPCRATAGKVEYIIGGHLPERVCCFACLRRKLVALGICDLPDARDWVVYMLLESAQWLNGSNAPKELAGT